MESQYKNSSNGGIESGVAVANKNKMRGWDVVLRFLALALSLTAAVVLGVNKETTTVAVTLVPTLPPVNIPVTAKWHDLSAFVSLRRRKTTIARQHFGQWQVETGLVGWPQPVAARGGMSLGVTDMNECRGQTLFLVCLVVHLWWVEFWPTVVMVAGRRWFFVVANIVACVYAAISLLLTLANRSGKKGITMLINFLDLTMVALLFSSVGAAVAIGLMGYEGNSHVQWKKVCNVFDRFCDRARPGLSGGASLAFFMLVVLATLNLHKKH
ncbi:hypothetical protein DH2020_048914 [Rehmannia glutinosa]|uniref:CASP-like protein n=1 Tax=Rehmannia glutinosa TaxID=99300 RepID=A0ABR0U487_REHGL